MIVTTAFLAEERVFQDAGVVVLALVELIFAVVGIALYFCVKNRAEDINIRE